MTIGYRSRRTKFFQLNETLAYDLHSDHPPAKELNKSNNEHCKSYYEGIFNDHNRRVVYSVRESTVQLIYYNVLISYQFFRFPLREMEFSQSQVNATAQWIYSIILQIITGNE